MRILSVIALLGMLTGCASHRATMEANALSAAFERRMDHGETSRQQEQDFIRAVSRFSLQVDGAVRSTKKAQATRDAAIKAVNPVDLGSKQQAEQHLDN